MLSPLNKEELSQTLRAANQSGQKVTAVDLRALNRVLEHTPQDMTVTVEAGLTLDKLQAQLARGGQWLPIDPPHRNELTVSELISENGSGPRRYGFGTIRDHLIGLQVVMADGRLVRSGGKVVKNVAGYDLMKLFVGGHDTLGFIVEATFKLLPLPKVERCIGARCKSLEEVDELICSVLESELVPVVFDLHRHAASPSSPAALGEWIVTLCFSGANETVHAQLERAAEMGFSDTGSLEHENQFWNDRDSPVKRRSILPSRLIENVRELGEIPFVARAGNGLIYYRGGPAPVAQEVPMHLMNQVKDLFDPNHILPELSV